MTVWFDPERQVWRYDFWRRGKRHFGYCTHPETGAAAQNQRDAREIEILYKARVIAAPANAAAPAPRPGGWTLAQAVIAYATRVQNKSSWPSISHHLEEILAFFGPDMLVEAIDEQDIERFRDAGLAKPVMIWVGGPFKRGVERKRAGDRPLWKEKTRRDDHGIVAPVLRDGRTVNRYLDTLSALLALAHDTRDKATKKRMLETMPKIAWADEYETSPRPFGLSTFAKLHADAPPHLQETMIVCVLFGFRLRQALYAKASRVDLELGGYWQERKSRGNKGRREIFIPFPPLGRDYIAALKARAERVGIDRLILYASWRVDEEAPMVDGKKPTRLVWRPIDKVSTAWRKLLARHGLSGAHTFHNIKTTTISNIASVASLAVAQDVGQHADARTTRKHYVAIDDDPKRAAIAELEQRLTAAGLDLTPRAGKVLALPGQPTASRSPIHMRQRPRQRGGPV